MNPNLNVVAKLAATVAAPLALCSAVLFGCAGTLAWTEGWIFLGAVFGFGGGVGAWLYRRAPELLTTQLLGKVTQRQLLLVAGLLLWFALLPLDAHRLGWSQLPAPLHGLGMLILFAAFALFFVSLQARLGVAAALGPQLMHKESGQSGQRAVVSGGPYRVVRHPIYSAFGLFVLGTPLLLGSGYGLLAGLVPLGLLARWVVLEERTLLDGLNGYGAYTLRVRFRLIPYFW